MGYKGNGLDNIRFFFSLHPLNLSVLSLATSLPLSPTLNLPQPRPLPLSIDLALLSFFSLPTLNRSRSVFHLETIFITMKLCAMVNLPKAASNKIT